MKTLIVFCLLFVVTFGDDNHLYDNVTLALYQPVERQLLDFKLEHPVPIGLKTMSHGEPVEVRSLRSLNSDQFNNQLLIDSMLIFDGERVPERVVHAKGIGAFGYFEVTNDVSKYTYADVFNGIGKRTPLVARLSTSLQNLGGTDLGRDVKGMAVKFYTKDGNFDLTCLHVPVFPFKDPIVFGSVVRSFKRNPATTLFDLTALWDSIVLNPEIAQAFFWFLSDYGLPNGYRRMDAFAIHTFELANKHGELHYVRFNVRTELGFSPLTTLQAAQIQATDLDYYNRDLYNNIALGNFPAWRIEMDVMTKEDIQKVDYDPFDLTRLWTNGTFTTVQIGRIVLNKNSENQFRDNEQAAYNPGHLVPGIPGPVDATFRARRNFYKDTQNHRLGRNNNKISINMPLYEKTYNRDGLPPVNDNGRDSPNYYPNSFNGPVPYVDEKRPYKKLLTLESIAIDLQRAAYFYNHILENEPMRQRFIDNLVLTLVPVTPPVIEKVMKLLYLIDKDLAHRVRIGLRIARDARAQQMAASAAAAAAPPGPIRNVPTAINH